MKNIKVIIALAVVALIAAFFIFDLGQYLSLDFLKSKHQLLVDYYQQNKVLSIAAFFLLYLSLIHI